MVMVVYYIGRRFHRESQTLMSTMVNPEHPFGDVVNIEGFLEQGFTVVIAPAPPFVMAFAELKLETLKASFHKEKDL